jgi:spore coat polysaccharide biosynthesis protein SpsF
MTEIAGRPVLGHLLDRLERCRRVDGVIVATSVEPSDDPVADYCADRDVACHRGPLGDVATRFVGVVEALRLDGFVRVSADSPLLDPALVDAAAEALRANAADVVTNSRPRTHPHGQSVEAVDAGAFRRALPLMIEPDDREHVTPALYRHPELFRIGHLPAGRKWPAVRLAIDEPEDLAWIAAIVGRMTRPAWDYALDEIVALAEGVS